MNAYTAEWELFYSTEWNCHNFMAELMEQGLSQKQAEREFAIRWGEFIRFNPALDLYRAKITRQ